MFYYNEAISKNILKDSVIVVMQAKNVPIHRGHINLINFAKQYGNVVVLIRDFKWFVRFCFLGIKDTEIEEDIRQQVESLESLGIQVVYQPLIPESQAFIASNIMTDKVRIEWFNSAKEKVKPFEDQLILQRKINSCILLEMRINFWKVVHGETIPFSSSVVGLDVDYFYAKIVCKNAFTNWPQNRIMYSSRDVDPETGFNYQTSTSSLTPEQRTSCLELREIIDGVRHRYVKGLNTELVNEINSNYPNKLWKMNDIAVLRDGIFKTSVLECLSFLFVAQDSSIIIVEDIMQVGKHEAEEEK
jgi:hypothetical protein